jgi:hypothetical protein
MERMVNEMVIFTDDLVFIGWIVGFVDGEGCFSIRFNKKASLNTGIEVRPSFSISQKSNSKDCIAAFVEYFDCGAIRYSKSDGTWKYEVRSLPEIIKKVIPFFIKYPLKTYKKNDFRLFCEICFLMQQNQHRNFIGLDLILHKAYAMNESGTRKATLAQLLEILRKHRNNPKKFENS